MTGFNLFFKRLKQDWHFQWKAVKTVIDWTIWVYLIIPAAIILLASYRSWWMETPEWLLGIPLELTFIVLYLFCWIGSLRTFLEEADQLFLLQNRQCVYGLKKSSLIYSVLLQVLKLFLIMMLFAPLLINHYQFKWSSVIFIWVFISSAHLLILTVRIWMDQISNILLKGTVHFAFFLFFGGIIVVGGIEFVQSGFLLLILITSSFQIIIILLLRRFIQRKALEPYFIKLDRKQKLKHVKMILTVTEFVPKETTFNRKRPLLFRHSERLFQNRSAENGVSELFIKTFIRNQSNVLSYLQIIGMTTGALFVIPPIWIKALIYIAFVLFLAKWLDSVWMITISKPFFKSIARRDDATYRAKIKVTKLFLFPAYGFVGLFLIITSLIRYLLT